MFTARYGVNILFFLFFFLQYVLYAPYVLYVSHKLNFIVLISGLSVTHTICLHFHFLVSTPGIGGI